jgi:choline kinase
MNKRAIILAAGRGSRMGKETELKPKCFTVLGGKRLLDWQLQSLSEAGIDNIIVVRGYKAEMFEGSFQKVDNTNWHTTNMVYSLFCVNSYDGETVISYSDIVYKKDHIAALLESDYDITITADKIWADLWKIRFEDPLDDAETFKSNGLTLQEIGKKTNDLSEIEAQYMGLIKLTVKGWQIMYDTYSSLNEQQKAKIDMTSMFSLLLTKNVKINIVFVEGGWCEADEYTDILAYENELNKNPQWKHNWR